MRRRIIGPAEIDRVQIRIRVARTGTKQAYPNELGKPVDAECD